MVFWIRERGKILSDISFPLDFLWILEEELFEGFFEFLIIFSIIYHWSEVVWKSITFWITVQVLIIFVILWNSSGPLGYLEGCLFIFPELKSFLANRKRDKGFKRLRRSILKEILQLDFFYCLIKQQTAKLFYLQKFNYFSFRKNFTLLTFFKWKRKSEEFPKLCFNFSRKDKFLVVFCLSTITPFNQFSENLSESKRSLENFTIRPNLFKFSNFLFV